MFLSIFSYERLKQIICTLTFVITYNVYFQMIRTYSCRFPWTWRDMPHSLLPFWSFLWWPWPFSCLSNSYFRCLTATDLCMVSVFFVFVCLHNVFWCLIVLWQLLSEHNACTSTLCIQIVICARVEVQPYLPHLNLALVSLRASRCAFWHPPPRHCRFANFIMFRPDLITLWPHCGSNVS